MEVGFVFGVVLVEQACPDYPAFDVLLNMIDEHSLLLFLLAEDVLVEKWLGIGHHEYILSLW